MDILYSLKMSKLVFDLFKGKIKLFEVLSIKKKLKKTLPLTQD